MDFVEKYTINNMNINDYMYLQNNKHVKDKIDAFDLK